MRKDRFYKANEEITLRFYQMPKALFNNPRYKGLSLGAKAMYSILRDRQELSISNNLKNDERWVDEEGNIYLLFPIEPRKGDERSVDEKEPRELSLTEILEIDRKTVMKYKKELVEYELIIDKRQGQGKVSRTYVLKPELPSDNVEKYMKSKKGTSKSPKKGLPEVQKFPGIDTDFSETDFSETINQSIESENKKENINKKETERLIDIDNKFKNIGYKTYNELLHELQLKIALNKYPYENWLNSVERAIWEMYYEDSTKIKNRMVNQHEVVTKLQNISLDMIINAIDSVNEASQYEKIKYPVAFMKTTIFNEIDEFPAKIQTQVNYDLNENIRKNNDSGNNYKNRFHNFEGSSKNYTEDEIEKIVKNKREEYYGKIKNEDGTPFLNILFQGQMK